MILHQLRVSNWRSVLNPVDIGPFSERVNVIHAPNGTGKSSVFEAMRRALFDAYHVSGQEISAVRPWGRSLTPLVIVEFSQSGVRYRLEKSFLDDASARLLRFEGGKFQPLDSGRAADTKVREILCAPECPGKGLSKQEHWGLAQVLWAPQGVLRLDSLSPSVTENLRAALGVQLAGDGTSLLEHRLEENYLTYFTKAGKPRTGKQAAPLIGLQVELENLQKQRTELFDDQQAFEQAARSVEDSRVKREQVRREAEELRKLIGQTRQKAELYQTLKNEERQKRLSEQAAKESYDALSQTLELIRTTRGEISRLTVDIQKAVQQVSELSAELDLSKAKGETARAERERARQRQNTLDERVTEMEDARAFVDDTKSSDALEARLKKLAKLDADLAKQKTQRAGLVAPDEKTIKDVRRLVNSAEKAEAALNASRIHLTIQVKRETEVRCDTDSRTLSANESATFSGSPDVEVEIEGFGIIRASGPEGDAAEHEKSLRESKKKLFTLTQPYGTNDPDRLQLLRDNANALDSEIESLEEKIEELLGEEDRDVLQQQVNEVNACIRERLRRFPQWEETPPVVSELQTALEENRKAVREAIRDAESAFDQAQSGIQGVQQRHGTTVALLNEKKLRLEAAQSRLNDLTKDDQSDAAREQARGTALMTWEAARTAVSACEAKLREFPGDPQQELGALERQFNALEAAENDARDAENQALGSLNLLAAQGVYSKLSSCEEALDDLQKRIQREKLCMNATQLLYETVNKCKAALITSVTSPVEHIASRMLSRIAGPRLGSIRISESFLPAAIKPELVPEPVDVANLSGGEQEQLFLVTRLALGQLLAKNERQLVVLDDVLNATDTGRIARLLTLLEEAADQLQIVILTCHPERYRAFEQAAFFDLHKLTN